ncbi:hypothetical protein, unlikely [Trypanosoma brucei brucei TREU927]|uniref:Uncharacterized protein n=1 Tax=Trypanosoma brucei brucei (strain 927/4 GUTat10.1) TaxID=185431 RepID=Q38E47_TRYB2|nr:hypothetical protein, unlikely [Trypanosoma brucei brucei TREU927]EAN76923.1 hypothetical protein, unlikely [Trypanosoma brucei brucei TREU927]
MEVSNEDNLNIDGDDDYYYYYGRNETEAPKSFVCVFFFPFPFCFFIHWGTVHPSSREWCEENSFDDASEYEEKNGFAFVCLFSCRMKGRRREKRRSFVVSVKEWR